MLPQEMIDQCLETINKNKNFFVYIFSKGFKTSAGYGYSICNIVCGIPPLTKAQGEIYNAILDEAKGYARKFLEDKHEHDK